jgi:hypothetical protein
MLGSITKRSVFFKRVKVRRRVFKKKKFVFVNFVSCFSFKRIFFFKIYKKSFLYKKYKQLLEVKIKDKIFLFLKKTTLKKHNLYVNFSLKKF